MRTVAGLLKRAMVSLALVLPAGLMLGAPGAAASSGGSESTAERCVDDAVMWSGSGAIAAGAGLDTGVTIAAAGGERLEVVGTSADGIDAAGTAHALPITVGGDDATAGATIRGGAMVVHGLQDGDVQISGATVALRRCVAVASQAEAGAVVTSDQLPVTGSSWRPWAAVSAAISVALGEWLRRVGTTRRQPRHC